MAGTFGWIRRLFTSLSKEDRELSAGIANITGRTPNNLDVYKLAVRHSSFASGANGEHNERLEFLGDAILGAVVAEYLFKKFPKRNEGFMTEIRSRLVNGEALGQLATKIGLDRLIQYEGRRKQPHTHRSMNGDAMEALIGAFFLDNGFEASKTFILDKLIKPNYDLNEVVESDHNHKSRMIEWAQKNGRKLSFEIAADSGRGNKDFVANVILDGKLFASGSGFSKKKAEQSAAMTALNKIKERNERSGGGEAPNFERRNRPDSSSGRQDQRRSREEREPRSERPDRQERGERVDRLERAEREERSERPARNERPERSERNEQQPRQERGDRPERQDRPDRTDRQQRPPRAPREDMASYPSAEASSEPASSQEPRPERQPRQQRPGRVNQEEMYNEATPLEASEEGGVTATDPRPERAPRERPARRERPPRRKSEESGIQDDANGIVPSVEPIPQAEEAQAPHETFPEAQPPSNAEHPVSDAEFKDIFRFKNRNPNRPERGSSRQEQAEPTTDSSADQQEDTQSANTASESFPAQQVEPAAPAVPFVVNKERIQPKAVEIEQAPPLPAPATASSSKRKWVNVTGASTDAQKDEPVAKPTPKVVESSQEASRTTDAARQALDSISSEADAFMTGLPTENTPQRESNQPEEQDGAPTA